MTYNTRIAPSPTGDVHIGTLRTAYFCWLAARASQGKFLVRIDDTDLNRNNSLYMDTIYQIFDWLSLDFDSTFCQSNRFDTYQQLAQQLVDQGLATRLENGAISTQFFDWMPRSWYDDLAGVVEITNTNIDQIRDLILIRGDQTPTYHFASVVDDYLSDINWVIRGTDHLTNTAKHLVIWQLLNSVTGNNKSFPKFSHVGLITKNKRKLSKRDPDNFASVMKLKDANYDPDAVLNFVLRLGWAPTQDDKSTAIITKTQAIDMFLTSGKMKNSPAEFDIEKLNSFDRKYKGRKLKDDKIIQDTI